MNVVDRHKVYEAIDEESELPGEMPDEMWNSIKNNRDAYAEAVRIAIRLTKENIKIRVAAIP